METLDDVIQKKMSKSLLSFMILVDPEKNTASINRSLKHGTRSLWKISVRCTSICSIANGEVKASTVHRMTSSLTAIRTPLTGTDDH